MSIAHAVLALVALQRGGELILAHANSARLLRQGGVEIDRAGYKWFVVLHAGWLIVLATTVPATAQPDWPLLALFLVLQAGRIWVIATLGRRWTTRLIVLPGAPPIASGPYRWLRHPNYWIVAAEIAILPLAFGAIALAIAFSLGNALLLFRRIRLEDSALGLTSHGFRETLPRRS